MLSGAGSLSALFCAISSTNRYEVYPAHTEILQCSSTETILSSMIGFLPLVWTPWPETIKSKRFLF